MHAMWLRAVVQQHGAHWPELLERRLAAHQSGGVHAAPVPSSQWWLRALCAAQAAPCDG